MIDRENSEDERDRVLSWLREFNFSENGEFMTSLVGGAESDFFIVSRDEEGVVLGGLRGSVLHRWVKVDVMAVCPDHRDQGIGRELVLEAEALGARAGCKYVYVDTMSFQAPEFYSKLGYAESGRLEDWDSHGHDKIFFTKRLLAEGDD